MIRTAGAIKSDLDLYTSKLDLTRDALKEHSFTMDHDSTEDQITLNSLVGGLAAYEKLVHRVNIEYQNQLAIEQGY